MMPDLGAYRVEVLSAYVGTLLLLAVLVAIDIRLSEIGIAHLVRLRIECILNDLIRHCILLIFQAAPC